MRYLTFLIMGFGFVADLIACQGESHAILTPTSIAITSVPPSTPVSEIPAPMPTMIIEPDEDVVNAMASVPVEVTKQATLAPSDSPTLTPTMVDQVAPEIPPLLADLPGRLVFLHEKNGIPSSLWTFSFETGQSTQMLSNLRGSAVLLQNMPPQVLIATNEILQTDLRDIYQFLLPELCLIENRCQNLEFSPDAHYLAYTAIVNPEIGCGSGGVEVHVWDVNSREMVQQITGAGFAQWISDTEFQFAINGCEAGNSYLWDMESHSSIGLGGGGVTFWASDRKALAGYELSFFGFHAAFWMYNIENQQLFEPQQGEGGRYDTLCWKPDGSQLVYTWQEFQPPSSYEFTIGPKQLWVMDTTSGEQSSLLLSEKFHYFIASGNEREWKCQWWGDWLQVREVSYTPVSTTLEPRDWGPVYCPLRGICSNEKILAINTETGEVKEWGSLNQESIMSLQMGPDLEREPVFVSLENLFALYPGINNVGLWYVPTQGEPLLLISEGYSFIYLDK